MLLYFILKWINDYYKSNRYHDSTCCCDIVWSKDDFISDGSTFSLRWMYIWTTRVALIRKVGFWNYYCAFACRILTFTAYLNALPLGVAVAQRRLILDIDKYVFNPYVLSYVKETKHCIVFHLPKDFKFKSFLKFKD